MPSRSCRRSRAVASGNELSRLTFGSASVRSFTALRRLMPLTPLGPGLLLFVGPPCSNKSNRFAHASIR